MAATRTAARKPAARRRIEDAREGQGADRRPGPSAGDPVGAAFESTEAGTLKIRVPLKFRHRPGRATIILPDDSEDCLYISAAGASRLKAAARNKNPNPALIRGLVRAHRWADQLAAGKYATISDLAKSEKVSRSYVSRLLRMTLLAPDITVAILDGRQPPQMDLKRAMALIPNEWAAQRARFGFKRVR